MIFATSTTLGQHFAYALGRLGVLESELLSQSDIDRLLGAESGEEAVKMLRDIEFVPTAEGDEPFAETLDRGATRLQENVESSVPPEKKFIFDILWLDGDRVKLAYALKEKRGFVSAIASIPESPVSAGFEPMLEGKFDSPQAIDAAVAEACNEYAQELAKRSRSKAIQTYVQHLIDIEQTRTMLRTPSRHPERASTSTSLSTGSASESKGIETIVFEKEAVASLREHLEDMKTMLLGPEALFSYAARAFNHLSLLRVLLTGKVNNLEIQEIKSLLPPLL